ncbi:peroxisomal membrane protein PEX13-like isoform X2 [Eriocheir sinensis]|uniref:peroxisomal membrane protein PEX13-like isoform X2 n=1 Tax=Eriocheir sinensis TaxID=95602 RepID=UPI0021C5A2A8|nr:peroxisomal membrane protein PEX13-like isoform X2 [Eriocheir sinensis]
MSVPMAGLIRLTRPNMFMPSSPHMMPGPGGGSSMPGASVRPPLPPRPATTAPYSTYPRPTYGGYGNMGMGMGMYGGTYRGFGQYGMSGLPDVNDENGFIQLAENSSRQAFQSIESIVHAFGSVSMMLESTYHAVYSSFRAVLGVADHFNRMKSHFAQIFSALAVVRTLRWLYNKLLFLIGLRSQDPSLEAVWRNANASLPNASQITEADIKASKSSWPIVLFLGVVFGGPYLIWRLLSSLVPSKAKSSAWMTGQEEHFAAVGQYPFQARMKNELSFAAGQPLILAPKDQQPSYQGWLLASNGSNVGLVPGNYIKILGLRSPQPQQESNLQKQGNQLVAAGIPSIPFPHQGQRPAMASHSGTTGRNYGTQPGIPYTQHRLPPPTQTGVPLRTWQGQGAPVNTQQGQRIPQPLQHGQGPPVTMHHGEEPRLTMQQGEGPPLTTHQGQGAPSSTQQGQGAPIVTQQGQGTTLSTQQGQRAPPNLQEDQGAPLSTQQGRGTTLSTQQRQASHILTQQGQGTTLSTQQAQEPPPLTQGPTPESSQSPPPAPQQSRLADTPLPPQYTPLIPSGGEGADSTLKTSQSRGEEFHSDYFDDEDLDIEKEEDNAEKE